MKTEDIDFIRGTVRDVPNEDRRGYMTALKDILKVSTNVSVHGEYLDHNLYDLVAMVVKAKKLPVISQNDVGISQ